MQMDNRQNQIMSIADRVAAVRERICAAAISAGRNPDDVRLVAVSKTRPPSDIVDCMAAGETIFGENYVQELVRKAASVELSPEWHFIGHLQSNKVRSITGIVTLIHSVDRLSLAEEISREWGKLGKSCDILLQVNVSGEESKSGVAEEGLIKLAVEISRLPYVRISGLMTMPPFFSDPELSRPCFARLRELSGLLVKEDIPNVHMSELSMGMSGDFEVAIGEGATLVRVGSAIFGERNP